MAYKYFPQTDADIQEMLAAAGLRSMEDLYQEVPEELKLKKGFDLPAAMSEIEVRRTFGELGRKNRPMVCFAGGGVYDRYTPAVINYIINRSEFQTAYTPYQAEISQGTLQYIFEYQTMMADLTGLDVSNASMYDGHTATAEAMMIAVATAKKRNKVLVSGTVNPDIRRVVDTYAKFHGVEVVTIAEKDGVTDRADMEAKLAANDVAGVIVAQPNYYGIVEDYDGFADACHGSKALFMMNCNASSLAVLKSPGEWGADIAVGDGQSLGIPMSYGGPYVGFLCATNALIRKISGRIVGGTTDANGRRAFVLTMQAREQHIRREKATSNICSNQGVMTLFVAIYLSLMGIEGLRKVNEMSYGGAHYLHGGLIATGKFEPVFDRPFLYEFCLRAKCDIDALDRRLEKEGIMGGVRCRKPDMEDCVLFAVTEKRTKEEIDRLISIVKEA